MFKLGRKGTRRIVCVDDPANTKARPAWATHGHFIQHLRQRVKAALRARKKGEKHLYPEGAELVIYELVEVSREPIDVVQTRIMLEEQRKRGR